MPGQTIIATPALGDDRASVDSEVFHFTGVPGDASLMTAINAVTILHSTTRSGLDAPITALNSLSLAFTPSTFFNSIVITDVGTQREGDVGRLPTDVSICSVGSDSGVSGSPTVEVLRWIFLFF